MITTMAPEDFLLKYTHKNGDLPINDHHYTGNIWAQQTENQGSVFHIEGRILAGLAAQYGGPILEIGSDLGISTRYLVEGAKLNPSKHQGPLIDAIDPIHKWDPDADYEWAGTINQFHGKTADWTAPHDRYSMCFIDGDHRYEAVCKDIEVAKRCVLGPLVFHDTAPHMPIPTSTSDGSEARRAVLDYLGNWNIFDLTTKTGLVVAYPPLSLYA